MSTPSHNDVGTSGEEFYRNGMNPNLPQQLPQLQQYVNGVGLAPQAAPAVAHAPVAGQHQPPPPHAAQFVRWANPMMGGSPYIQHGPPQQIFNDVLYNLQAQAALAASVPNAPVSAAGAQQETYSVLRVGNGNFLKIYHCPENAMGPMPGETSFTPMHHHYGGQPQQQPNVYHHINQSAQPQPQAQSQMPPPNNNSGPPQVFNSYELFSSNTFTQLPTAEMPPVLLLGPSTNESVPMQELVSDNELPQEAPQLTAEAQTMSAGNNMDNWIGHSQIPLYSQFETAPLVPLPIEPEFVSSTGVTQDSIQNASDKADMCLEDNRATQSMPTKSNHSATTVSMDQPSKEKSISFKVASTAGASMLNHHKSEIPRQEAPKKRIVAEVKPMRMTYSDVLSKINNQTQNSSTHALQQSGLSSNGNVRHQQKSSGKSANSDNGNASTNFINSRRNLEELSALRSASTKKSPTHDNKENQQQQQPTQQQQQQLINNKIINNNATTAQKRSAVANSATTATTAPVINNNGNGITQTFNGSVTSHKQGSTTTATNAKHPLKGNVNEATQLQQHQQQPQQKKRSNKTTDFQVNGTSAAGKNTNDVRMPASKSNGSTANNSNGPGGVYNTSNNTYARKSTKSQNSNSASSYSSSGNSGQQRSRYQNNSNASYSYSSTKRNRNGSSYGASASLNNSSYNHGTLNNRNYELAKRFLQAWYTYTLKILIWLFNLVYDIVVVGCSILYERLTSGLEYCRQYAKQLYKDLKQNSNKPSLWFKNWCRRFDARFAKDSKWALWRRFYKKRPPETTSETIKTGRLPQTGEEAMYQLLNCKGKDAYSILGVPPNSSQEQIRKHYKKIAVLVHPDKNKQPGAEEAFKVLQRAFELIGEPENRLSYDQGLAEALHAEKAWTELHDLLSQLQTKITEAANTIRCSTCGLRHPRKMTDRPHYAARECASCKIRHSAREGDIWAETSMLGLRWKYLALMEGKVYDITEWANCQKGALAHLEPNSHMVQYRIVRGAQQQQQQQQQQQKQQTHHQQQQHQQNTGSHYGGGSTGGKFKHDNIPTSEASLHEFLDNLYSGQHPQQQQNTSAYAGSSRRRNRRN